MSVLNPPSSDDEPLECPLCLEYLELDDINFYPCSCGYQICRFCWNKIRTEGSGNCPACRSPYAENPADFKPLTAEELAKIKAEKRQRDAAKKQKISENRKHLANVRVVQRNLVFVVGLSPRLSDPDVLKKPEYFGKFGKIHKVVINQNTAYAGSQTQGPSASAYVTYYKPEDALKAIQAVNNIFIDGRTLKASLGTTKYCSHFMKNQACPKHDCMYLHELGDEAASFTKEEMQQGKHTDYERALHDEMLAVSDQQPSSQGGNSTQQQSGKNNKQTTAAAGETASRNNATSAAAASDASEASVVSMKNTKNMEQQQQRRQQQQARQQQQQQQQQAAQHQTSRTPSPKQNKQQQQQHQEDRGVQPQHPQGRPDGWPTLDNNGAIKQDEENGASPDRKTNYGGGGANQYLDQQQQLLLGLKDGVLTASNQQEGPQQPRGGGRQVSDSQKDVAADRANGHNSVSAGGARGGAHASMTEQNNQEPWPSSSSHLSPHAHLQQQQQQQHFLQKQQQDVVPKLDSPLFGEDDLGFDPFAETQKGLADLMENESRLMIQHQQQNFLQQQLLQQQQQRNGVSASPSPPQPPAATASQPPPSSSTGPARIKAPPPGFSSSNGQPPAGAGVGMHPRFNGGSPSPFDNFAASSHLHQPQPPLHHPEFGLGNHLHKLRAGSPQQQQQQSWQNQNKDWQEGFRALLPNVNVSFGNLPGGGGGGSANPGTPTSSSANTNGHPPPMLPGFASQHHPQSMSDHDHVAAAAAALARNQGWGSSSSGNDLGLLDPAIVGGSLTNHGGRGVGGMHHAAAAAAAAAGHHPHHSGHLQHNPMQQQLHHQQRSESPSSWIKTNLEQLTGDSPAKSGVGGSGGPLPGLLPGFANLNLGGFGSSGGSRWGGNASGGAGGAGGGLATVPPPGFAVNRGGGAGSAGLNGFGDN